MKTSARAARYYDIYLLLNFLLFMVKWCCPDERKVMPMIEKLVGKLQPFPELS